MKPYFVSVLMFFAAACQADVHENSPIGSLDQEMPSTILITGGAGYVAAPSIFLFVQHGYHVVALDTKPVEQTALMPLVQQGLITYVQADIADSAVIQKLCKQFSITVCLHTAAFIDVGASVQLPQAYYENNAIKTMALLDTLLSCGVRKVIFSSSCAVYGMPDGVPIDELSSRRPVSPYGNSKLLVELLLADYAKAYGLQYIAFRYGNVAGGVPEHGLYELHNPETHLIPRLLTAVCAGEEIAIFGNDYQTPDGTCVRDYIHVSDIAQAHLLAVKYLFDNADSHVFNLGAGRGYSVLEVVDAVARVVGVEPKISYRERRAGDPDQLILRIQRAQTVLGWQPINSDISFIVRSAYQARQQ